MPKLYAGIIGTSLIQLELTLLPALVKEESLLQYEITSLRTQKVVIAIASYIGCSTFL